MHEGERPADPERTSETPVRPSKLEAVRLAKEQRGDASAVEISGFVETAFGMTISPAIVMVLLASLREREALEVSKRKALELIEQARIAEAEQATGKKAVKRKRGA